METNAVVTVTQAAQTAASLIPQIITLITSLIGCIGVIIAYVGRYLHASKTGNGVISAMVSGTNTPAPKV